MWKTDCWSPHLEALERHLCPNCDSLGPHRAVTDELPADAFLECIDCGAMLGRLTPQGVEPLGDTWASVSVVPDRRGPLEHDPASHEGSEKVSCRYPESICEALQITTLVGLLLKTRQ